jgi:integrase/recombinase XerD
MQRKIIMNVLNAINIFRDHQVATLKRSTQLSYDYLLIKLQQCLADRPLDSISTDDVSKFLDSIVGGALKSTRRLRYAQVKAFFNFIIDKCELNIKNPCAYPQLSKQYKTPKQIPKTILDKEFVDELIYKTSSSRDRLILELQARCGLRVSEVLKLTVADVSDRKLIIREPNPARMQKLRSCRNKSQSDLASISTTRVYDQMTVYFRFAIQRYAR